VTGLLAVWLGRAAYVWASGLAVCVAGTVVWSAYRPTDPMSLAETNLLCLAAGSTLWSAIGLVLHAGCLGHSASAGPERPTPVLLPTPYTHPAAALALVGSIVLVILRLVADVVAIDHVHAETLSWVSLGAAAAALAMLLPDRRAAWSRPGLYLAGLAAIGLGLDTRWLAGHQLAWTATIDLAAFALAAAGIGWALAKWLPDWQWPPKASNDTDATRPSRPLPPGESDSVISGWFSSAQRVVVVIVAVLAGWVALDPAFDPCALGWLAGRIAGPVAATLLLAAAAVMVQQTRGVARRDWQLATMLLSTVVLATAGWWRLPGDMASLWLHRAVVLLAAAALGAIGSGIVAARSTAGRRDWLAAARTATTALGTLAVVTLACVLSLEFYFYTPDGTPMAVWAMVTVAVALVGLAAGLIALAVLPGTDPAELDLRARTIYVYGAELVLVLLGVHLRLAEPWLFRLGIIEQYWIYLVMGVAFVGAGLAEWFHRRGVGVLAGPLERTALALPLAAAVGFWFMPHASPAFWFLAALFYGVVAIGRRNGWSALAAVATGNMGLWVLWHREGLHFIDRPQLWLIPAALCALVAEYLHHDRLEEGQSAAIRYMALSVIYVSSTVEFMRGVGESVWLPLVLVGLSLIGVLAGIMLRIRSFLYLGVTFLLVVMVRMILFAAIERGQMWVFWSAVVALGLSLIGLFAVFEKRRNDVLAALERFKGWDQ